MIDPQSRAGHRNAGIAKQIELAVAFVGEVVFVVVLDAERRGGLSVDQVWPFAWLCQLFDMLRW